MDHGRLGRLVQRQTSALDPGRRSARRVRCRLLRWLRNALPPSDGNRIGAEHNRGSVIGSQHHGHPRLNCWISVGRSPSPNEKYPELPRKFGVFRFRGLFAKPARAIRRIPDNPTRPKEVAANRNRQHPPRSRASRPHGDYRSPRKTKIAPERIRSDYFLGSFANTFTNSPFVGCSKNLYSPGNTGTFSGPEERFPHTPPDFPLFDAISVVCPAVGQDRRSRRQPA